MILKTTRTYIEGLATALSVEKRIEFIEADYWKTDVDKKTIWFNIQDLLLLDPMTAKGLVLHEVAHINHSSTSEDSELAKQYPQLQEVYKTFEDIRIEKKMNHEYGDFSKEGFTYLGEGMMRLRANDITMPGKLSRITQFNTLLKANSDQDEYDYHNYSGSKFSSNLSNFQYQMDQKTREIFNKLSFWSVKNTAEEAINTHQIKKYVDTSIFPLIKELFDEQQNQSGQGFCQTSLSKGKPGDKKTQPKKGEEGKQKETDMSQLWGHGKTDEFMVHRYDIPTNQEIEGLLSPYINTLTNKLRDVLKETTSSRYTGAYKQGTLLSKNAFKVLLNETRIFSKKTNPDTPKYVVTLVLDESGSMRGNGKVLNTYLASYLLMRTCQKLRFKVNLVAYDHIFRDLKTLDDYREQRGGDNNEIKALQHVQKITNKDDDNLVFIMTDGGACVSESGLLRTIKEMEKDNYTVLAVGIGLGKYDYDYMKRFYPIHVNAANVTDLPLVVIKLLKQLIHR